MDNTRFRSGSFSEMNSTKRQASKKTSNTQTTNKFSDIENCFIGQTLDKEMRVSSFQNGSIKVVKGGELRISGGFTGDIMIAGGSVRISGMFNGNIIMTRGELRISGAASGAMRLLGGDIKCSGMNNLQTVYQ